MLYSSRCIYPKICETFHRVLLRSKYILLNLIVGEIIWEAKKKNVPKINLIKRIKDYHFQLNTRTIFLALLYCFLLFLPTIIVYKLYEGPSMKPIFVLLPIGLYWILKNGCQFSYNIAAESCEKNKKICLYLFWFFINIGVVWLYYYLLPTSSIYTTLLRYEMPLAISTIDSMWSQELVNVKYLFQPNSMTANAMFVPN